MVERFRASLAASSSLTTSLICTLREDSLDDTLCYIFLLIPGEYTQASTKWRH